jgi:transposase
MEFRELSDEQWKFIRPYLPPQPITGKRELMTVRSSMAFSLS